MHAAFSLHKPARSKGGTLRAGYAYRPYFVRACAINVACFRLWCYVSLNYSLLLLADQTITWKAKKSGRVSGKAAELPRRGTWSAALGSSRPATTTFIFPRRLIRPNISTSAKSTWSGPGSSMSTAKNTVSATVRNTPIPSAKKVPSFEGTKERRSVSMRIYENQSYSIGPPPADCPSPYNKPIFS